jgi:hypothetical protein
LSVQLLTILAVVNLLITLALCGAMALLARRTLAALSVHPSELAQRMIEIEAEWASTLDLLTKQQKKLAKRTKDESRAVLEGDSSPDLAAVDPHQRKAALRAVARQRGLMR